MDIRQKVVQLISMQQHTDTVAFFARWHDCDALLLHQILCLANNTAGEDSYLIFGVEDFCIIGLEQTDTHSRLKNVLKTAKFADQAPHVCFHRMLMDNKIVDVLHIIFEPKTPYYLVEDFKAKNVLKSHTVYAKSHAQNTPLSGHADFYTTQQLWKNRFSPCLSPLQRVHIYIQEENNWQAAFFCDTLTYYYIPYPEFTVEFVPCKPKKHPLYNALTNSEVKEWFNVLVRYHQTVLGELDGVCFGEDLLASAPEVAILEVDETSAYSHAYDFFINGTLAHLMSSWVFRHASFAEIAELRTLYERFLVFKNHQEQSDFHIYVQTHHADFYKLYRTVPSFYMPQFATLEHFGTFEDRLRTQFVLAKLLLTFRETNPD